MLIFLSAIFLIIVKALHLNNTTTLYSFFTYIFYYSKYIILLCPFILIYFNPQLLKKLLKKFQKIDNQPIYNNMNDMMMSYFDIKNNNKNKIKINYPTNYRNQQNNNNNFNQNNNNYRTQQNQNNNNNFNQNNNNFNRNNNNFIQKTHKRNVSESKKKFIASNQRWRCSHCNTLLDNTYEVDHIIALYKGGTNELNNLEALCRNCHGKKTFREKMGLL